MAKIASHQPDRAVGEQLLGYPRADNLFASNFDLVAEHLAHLGASGLLRLFAAGLLGDADQHVLRTAELLQLDVAQPQPAERRAHLGQIGGAGLGLHLDQRAADEVDAEIQAIEKKQQDRNDRQQRGDRKADPPKAHEVELGVVRDDAQERN